MTTIGRVSVHPARLGGPATACDPVTTEGCGVPVTAHATDITQVSTRTGTMASGGRVEYRGHSGDAMGTSSHRHAAIDIGGRTLAARPDAKDKPANRDAQ